jgi:hypothetical protein
MIYHLYRLISCWLSSLTVEYHLLRTIFSYVAWYSSPIDDIQLKKMILIRRGWYSSRADNIQLKQMILIWRGQYSSRADDIHPMEPIFIQERRISSMIVDSWNYNQPLEIIFNHWRWYSATGDHNQPLGMIIARNRWYIVCSRWIYHPPQIPIICQGRYQTSILTIIDKKPKKNQFISPNLEFINFFVTFNHKNGEL